MARADDHSAKPVTMSFREPESRLVPGGTLAARSRVVPDPAAYIVAENPHRKMLSTFIICAGCLLTGLTLPDTPAEIDTYRYGAYAIAAVLALAFFIESAGNMRSLIRVDVVALFGLYFLTFAEFLHPHVRILFQQYTGAAVFACQLVLIGTAALAIGRHFPMPIKMGLGGKGLPELSPRSMFLLFLVMFFLGFLWVLISVRFNLFKIATSLLAERFERPWQRTSLGGWSSFLTELNLLLYPAAAFGGYIFARAKDFSLRKRAVVAVLLVVMLVFDTAEGARNVVLIRAGLFVACYFLSNREAKSIRIIAITAVSCGLLWILSGYMLEFRGMGLNNYFNSGAQRMAVELSASNAESSFMLDNNLVSIARVTQVYPTLYPFPGSEIVVQILTKWVPRALWAGKPIALTNSVEYTLGAGDNYTIAVTYVGEAYLIAGVPTVILVSFILGSLSAAWTKVGLAARTNLEMIYYATGFFAAMLGMRSVMFITIAIVPTVAFYVAGRILDRRGGRRVGYAR